MSPISEAWAPTAHDRGPDVAIHAVRVLACLISAAAVAGCTTLAAGTPVPGATPTSETTADQPPGSAPADEEKLPHSGAPNVADPLDISRYVDDPCLALTADQAEQLSLPHPGEPDETPLGKACSWVNRDSFLSLDLSILNENPTGLSSFYHANDHGKYEFFEPLPPIEGFPAVAYDVLDERDSGRCPIAVGVANDLAFEAALQLGTNDTKDACTEGTAAVALVLRTMKG